MGNMCMSSMAAAQAKAEEGVRAAGGGDMLDKAKEKAADGVPIGFGKTVDIPDLATKGGECHVGVKYTCKAGKTVDAQFCAIEFNKKGEKIGCASYEVNATPDGAINYLGDSYGTEGGSEYVSLKLADLADDVQAIVMCIYIYNDCVMDDYDELKLMFKAVAGETIMPVCQGGVDWSADGRADAVGCPAAQEGVHNNCVEGGCPLTESSVFDSVLKNI